MSHLPFSERDIERLLEGNVPPGRGDLADLARVFARVRAGVEGEPVPPMSARLLAELDAAEVAQRRPASDLERAAERRRVRQGRRRWRVVAAAAAIVVICGGVFAGLRGPLGDDLRTRPGDDEPVSVAEPESGPTSTVADGGTSGGTESGPDDTPQVFSDDDEPGDLGVGDGASGGVATTERPPEEAPAGTFGADDAGDGDERAQVDWGEVSDQCGSDYECWIDAAEQPCEHAGAECWAAASEACGRDMGCRYMLVYMCGDTDECRDAVFDNRDRHHGR
jgi:hypothetical protein